MTVNITVTNINTTTAELYSEGNEVPVETFVESINIEATVILSRTAYFKGTFSFDPDPNFPFTLESAEKKVRELLKEGVRTE